MSSYNLSGTLTREEAFHFACWAIAQERAAQDVYRSSYRPPEPYQETVFMQALRELLEAYPPRPGDPEVHGIHARLSREPDRAVLARYFPRISERGRNGRWDLQLEGDDLAWWNVHRCWLRIVEAREAPPPPPRPMRLDLLNTATPAQALEAFLHIPEGRAPEEGSEEEALIAAGLNAWIRGHDGSEETREARRPKDCACDTRQVHPLRPEQHLARCPRDPAWQEVGRLQSALRSLGHKEPPGPDLDALFATPGPGRHTPWLTEREDAQKVLADWMGGAQQSGAGMHLPRVLVHAVLVEAVRLADPDAVPCPWCAGAVGLANLAPHLRDCELRPAARALRELRAALGALPENQAEVALAAGAELHQVREALRELVAACDRFYADQGWDGERAYSKAWCERPWLQALDRAEEIAAPRRDAPPNVHRDTARHTAALIELLDACRTYWRGGSDGGDRSLYDDDKDAVWRRHIEKAKSVLDGRTEETRQRG